MALISMHKHTEASRPLCIRYGDIAQKLIQHGGARVDDVDEVYQTSKKMQGTIASRATHCIVL